MAMNSVTSTTSEYQKLRKSLKVEKRPFLMLKDYLLDDLSSCSSSGFKSFPRRQCCSTIRLLTEVDVKTKPKTLRTSQIPSKSNATSTTINKTLCRASVAFLNAVRLISLPSTVKSLTPSPSTNKTFLPRSFSGRKIFRKRFWRKTAEKKVESESNAIKQWKSFREYLEEKDQPSGRNDIVASPRVSIDTSSKHSNTTTTTTSWDDNVSNFTSENSGSSSGSSEVSASQIDVDTVTNTSNSSSEKNVSSKRTDTAIGGESPETTTMTSSSSEDSNRVWSSEKEQFSPVSVLDCPFEDDEEITSPFPCATYKHRSKSRRLENLSQLEPMDLEKRIGHSRIGNGNGNGNTTRLQPYSAEETKTMQKEEELLNLINTAYPEETSILQMDNLLLDFFAESLMENNNHNGEQELLNIAQNWIEGQPSESYLGWEVKEQRKVYLRDMEKDGMWKIMDQEKQELVHALELECLTSLVDELLDDLMRMHQ